jgi:hypothetical protein
MSDDVIPHAGLRGEKLSIDSPYNIPAEISAWEAAAAGLDLLRRAVERQVRAFASALSMCAALALWSAPALLLFRYTPEQLLDGLVRVAVKPTAIELLTVSAVLLYFVITGLLLGAATAPQLRRHGVFRMLLRLAVAPLIGLSLGATIVVALPLFIGTLIKCFPDLL